MLWKRIVFRFNFISVQTISLAAVLHRCVEPAMTCSGLSVSLNNKMAGASGWDKNVSNLLLCREQILGWKTLLDEEEKCKLTNATELILAFLFTSTYMYICSGNKFLRVIIWVMLSVSRTSRYRRSAKCVHEKELKIVNKITFHGSHLLKQT